MVGTKTVNTIKLLFQQTLTLPQPHIKAIFYLPTIRVRISIFDWVSELNLIWQIFFFRFYISLCIVYLNIQPSLLLQSEKLLEIHFPAIWRPSNQRFSDVFRVYSKRPAASNGSSEIVWNTLWFFKCILKRFPLPRIFCFKINKL